MSQEQSIKTEKPTYTYPSARKTPTAYNVPASLEWVFDVPNGKMLAGFILDAKLITTGAGMTTAKISQIFKSIKAYADGNNLTLDVDQYVLDLLPIFTQWAKHHDDYADLTIGQLATGARVVQDDANVATGATLYGYWKVAAPLQAQKQLRFKIETYAMTTPFGSGMTAGLPSISIVPIWANVGKRKQYNIYAKQLSSVIAASYRGVEIGACFAASEFSTITNGIKFGGDLTPEETLAKQSNVGNDLNTWAIVNGAAVDNRLTTIQDPATGASVYVLADKFDGQAAIEINFSSAQTLKTIVMSEVDPGKVEVR